MKARWRIIIAAGLAVAAAGSPALAQDATAPAQNEMIGPPQLRDFNLGGTVTRRAEQPAESSSTQQSPAEPARESAQRPPQSNRSTGTAESRPDPAPRREQARTEPASPTVDLPPPTRARPDTQSAVTAVRDSRIDRTPAFAPVPEQTIDVSESDLPMLPWLLAALAMAGAAGWYFLRQRHRESYAGAGTLAFQGPSPAPQPAVRTPPRPPAATPPRAAEPEPAGIVSTRLRPWLEIEFTPLRAVVDEQKAAIQFELSIFNSGSVPARDVLIEGCMFNAGAAQDQQIRTFFDNPIAQGDRIPVIPPLQRVQVKSAVVLPRDQVRPIEIEGRSLFVPMAAFNALYSWSRGEGQSSTSYLVGKDTKSEKLGPFRLDLGPRMFRSLGFREHALRLRK